MTWSWFSFLVGLSTVLIVSLIIVPAMGLVLRGLHVDEILTLRVALGDLVRAVQESGGNRDAVDKAMSRAKMVLEGER